VVADLHARLSDAAASEGLFYHRGPSQAADTFAAHRMLHLAAASGIGAEAMRRLQRAFVVDELALGDGETLVTLMVDAGIDRELAH
jgi:predicted DsbA family dithiol-disulfide isomerase